MLLHTVICSYKMELVGICVAVLLLIKFILLDIELTIKVIFSCAIGFAVIILSISFGYHDAQYEKRLKGVSKNDTSDEDSDD